MVDEKPSRILDFLYLGGKHHAKDYNLLKELSITHILNITPPRSTDPIAGVPNFFEKKKNEFQYKRLAILDNQAEDILQSLDECISFIRQSKYYGNVLVHCNKGVSRSVSIVIAYLMKEQEMDFSHALNFVSLRRPMANPNPTFRIQLQEYENKLKASILKSFSVDSEKTNQSIGPSLPPHLQQAHPSTTKNEPSEEIRKSDLSNHTYDVEKTSAKITLNSVLPSNKSPEIIRPKESSEGKVTTTEPEIACNDESPRKSKRKKIE